MSEINMVMSAQEQARTEFQVDALNKALGNRGAGKQNLDKDDFLKLLIAQLTHQDPTKPMEDREFIAQMAQFSSLEQMTNMNQEFSKMAGVMAKSQAVSLLGKTVTVTNGAENISGVVEEVSGNQFPQVRIDGRFYDYSQVESVKN